MFQTRVKREREVGRPAGAAGERGCSLLTESPAGEAKLPSEVGGQPV